MGEKNTEYLVAADDLIEQYAVMGHKSQLAFARFLHKIEPTRGVNAWRIAVQRWLAKDSNNTLRPTPNEEIDTEEGWHLDTDYYYDTEGDTYLTFLECAGGIVVVPGEQHRTMKQSYSNMDGVTNTISIVAREQGFPRQWAKEYIRKHGWVRDMEPFTDEEMLSKPVDELVGEMLTQQRRAFHKKLEKRKWTEIEKDANTLRELDEVLLNDFRELLGEQGKATKTIAKITPKHWNSNNEYALVISPTDLHWGKYGWVDEVGEQYGFKEGRERLMEKTGNLIQRLPGRPEKIIMATGSDWFHVDTSFGTTTKGTPQDMCGSPAEILMTGCTLAREHIDLLRAVAPVKVVFMPGNHDRHSSLALMMYLSVAYEGVKDVEVVVSPAYRQYVTYGNSLIGFTHGDSIRPNKLPSIMATEAREDWGACGNHIWFHGHKHFRLLVESEGAFVVQLPSLAGEDRYHAQHGYISRAGLCAHLIDKEQGLIGSLYAPVSNS
tara:strand:+ start:5559 stop:7034 length:1476 start_codon:yes stop_codon:yes gene_type:complete